MAQQSLEEMLTANRLLSDQLRQARADLHRLGVCDQNRALIYAAIAGAVGLVFGVGIGVRVRGKR